MLNTNNLTIFAILIAKIVGAVGCTEKRKTQKIILKLIRILLTFEL